MATQNTFPLTFLEHGPRGADRPRLAQDFALLKKIRLSVRPLVNFPVFIDVFLRGSLHLKKHFLTLLPSPFVMALADLQTFKYPSAGTFA